MAQFVSSLSHSKPKRNVNAQILLPPASALLQSPPPSGSNAATMFSTPTSSPHDAPVPKCSHHKSVQFGVSQAAEYDLDAPSQRFTPLPFEVAQQRFPLNVKNDETEGEEIAETKENSAMLAEWEQDFDSLIDDGENDEEGKSPKHRKRQHSKRQKSSKRHRKGSRSERRRSSTFCSPHNAKALYDPTHDADSTPEKQKAAVIDNLASLSVKSPSPQQAFSQRTDSAGECDERAPSLSPLPSRRLSTEEAVTSRVAMETSRVAIISQEEEMETPSKTEGQVRPSP